MNYFFLTAGAMALAFSVGHAAWGQRFVVGDVKVSGMPDTTKHMLLVIWNQPTVFHLFSAVALVIAAMSVRQEASPLALFIGLVSFGFFLNFVVTSLARSRTALAQIVPQTFALMVYLGIILAGIYAG